MNNLRQETEKSINDLRKELKMEVTNMESSIASAVIKAINANSPNNMEVDQSELASTDSSHTTTTTKSMMDRLDSLTQIVQLLAEKVQDIAEIQEENANKRARSLEPTSRKILQSPNRENAKEPSTRSPPAKLPRPTARTPPPKLPLPPNGIPKLTGTQEGS
jgi:hypothetical protein